MKTQMTFAAVIVLLVGPQHVCAQEPNPADQKPAKAPEPGRERLSKGLAEGGDALSNLKGNPSADLPVTLRYVLPVQPAAVDKSSAPRWGLAAPIVDGFSNPNEIVYDQTYVDKYVNWAKNTPIICGAATYTIATPDGVVKIHGGLDEAYLGHRFQAEELLRFLKARTAAKTVERTFRVDRPEAANLLRERPESTVARRLRHSPWDRDTQAVVRLLALARYKPAYSLFKALLNDPSPAVRSSAVGALGGIAPVVPEAVKDLAHLLPDKNLGGGAADGLTVAGGVAVPALVEAMNHPDHAVRNRAVFALARMHPFEAAVPGLLAALQHKDPTIRQWALSVVIDLQGRGVSVARDDLIDALALRLADGDDETRRSAAIALVNLKAAAARARPALLKAAAEDRGHMVSQYAREALKAIDAATPRDK